jgi:hypothetical protein
MESILIHARSQEALLEQVKRILEDAKFQLQETPTGLVVVDGDSRAYVERDLDTYAYYEPDDRSKVIDTLGPATDVIAVQYSDIDVAKAIVVAVAKRLDVVVDNDHGFIAVGAEFARRLEREPGWDWRTSST